MKAYHITPTKRTARKILAEGLRDSRGTYLTMHQYSGVWISDRPLIGLLPYDIDAIVCLEVTIDGRLIRRYEWIEAGKGYREWLVPAALLNSRATLRRLTDEELKALDWG